MTAISPVMFGAIWRGRRVDHGPPIFVKPSNETVNGEPVGASAYSQKLGVDVVYSKQDPQKKIAIRVSIDSEFVLIPIGDVKYQDGVPGNKIIGFTKDSGTPKARDYHVVEPGSTGDGRKWVAD